MSKENLGYSTSENPEVFTKNNLVLLHYKNHPIEGEIWYWQQTAKYTRNPCSQLFYSFGSAVDAEKENKLVWK